MRTANTFNHFVQICDSNHMHLATMWQSLVEIKDYFIVYLDHTAFEVPYHWTSAKGGAHARFMDSLDIHVVEYVSTQDCQISHTLEEVVP